MGIIQSLFGGSSSKNTNDPFLKNALSGSINAFGGTNSLMSSLLGQGDPTMGQQGFQTYKNNSGFNFALGEGLRGITGTMAARGLLNSGAAGRAFTRYGEGLSAQRYQDYLKSVLGLGGMQLGAAGVLADSGKKSSEDSGGLGKFIGAILASDIRLKENIVKIGETEEGLNIYSFTYTAKPDEPAIGVMAQEVAELYPEALGPVVDGYMTVDYGKLKELI